VTQQISWKRLEEIPVASGLTFYERERDLFLSLESPIWPSDEVNPPGWNTRTDIAYEGTTYRVLERQILSTSDADARRIRSAGEKAYAAHQRAAKEAGERPQKAEDFLIDIEGNPVLRERLLRFPSVPIYGLGPASTLPHRAPAGFHSFRVLDHPERTGSVGRVYLLQHGLNEIPGAELFYRLAGWILAGDPDAACIVRPFPGHLTRYSVNSRFAETPLDRYLEDSAELFRHYLRFMIETRWFLSTIAPRNRYSSLAGAGLVGTREVGETDEESRSDLGTLARSVSAEYASIRDAVASRSVNADRLPLPPTVASIEDSLGALRAVLGWNPTTKPAVPNPVAAEAPTVHAIGYSLGGFVSQSVFMTWPYVVSTCTTICSGGALRDLAPTAFAHPEEWQTLVHSLRYQLDRLMSDGELAARDGDPVLGMDGELYDYLLRIFYEVFEQDYRSSYQSRVSEYLRRIWFIVGGNDPIVRPQSVLDAAPAEGANIFSIADMSHFLSTARLARHPGETEQREFWLPQLGGILPAFAQEGEYSAQRSLANGWRKDDNSAYSNGSKPRKLASAIDESERLLAGVDGSLASPTFERFLDALCAKASETGHLFIFRNDIPTFMLSEEYQVYRAKSLHHSDDKVRAYLEGLERRRAALLGVEGESEGMGRRLTVVLPSDAVDRLGRSFRPGMAQPTSEAPMGGFRLPKGVKKSDLAKSEREGFLDRLASEPGSNDPNVWRFTPGPIAVDGSDGIIDEALRIEAIRETIPFLKEDSFKGQEQLAVTRLPDLWLYVSRDALLPSSQGRIGGEVALISSFARIFTDKAFEKDKRNSSIPVEQPVEWIQKDQIRGLVVSRAKNNPRHRGRTILERREFGRLAVHASVALLRSERWVEGGS